MPNLGEGVQFRCYQTTGSACVVVGDARYPDRDDAVVIVSKAIGAPEARLLMRLCEAMLNGDMMAAEDEFAQWERMALGEEDDHGEVSQQAE